MAFELLFFNSCLTASLYLSIVLSESLSIPSTAYAAEVLVSPAQESVQSKATAASLASTINTLVDPFVMYKPPCASLVNVTAVFAVVLVSVLTAVVVTLLAL